MELGIPECLFYIVIIGLAFLLEIFDVSIITILALNGSIFSFIYVFFIPLIVHWKCVWIDNNTGWADSEVKIPKNPVCLAVCGCSISFPNKVVKVLELIWTIVIFIMGLGMTIYSIINLFENKETVNDVGKHTLEINNELL